MVNLTGERALNKACFKPVYIIWLQFDLPIRVDLTDTTQDLSESGLLRSGQGTLDQEGQPHVVTVEKLGMRKWASWQGFSHPSSLDEPKFSQENKNAHDFNNPIHGETGLRWQQHSTKAYRTKKSKPEHQPRQATSLSQGHKETHSEKIHHMPDSQGDTEP
jgi:hypothetical protein